MTDLTLPARRLYVPREYQPLGTNHIIDNERCALWAGMGLGKGVMALTALAELEMVHSDIFPVLVLGPLRVARDVWTQEPEKWEHLSHLHTVAIVGDAPERLAAVRMDSPIYSVNYENIEWLIEYWGDRWPYKTVIADESTKLKGMRGGYRTHPATGKVYFQGAGASRAKALAAIAHVKVKRFIELSGRPAPNGLQDLWGQMWFLDKGARLGRNYEAFTKRWFTPKRAKRPGDRAFGVEPKDYADAEIHAEIKDLCLTIDPKDYFDLKDPFVNLVWVDLPPKARKQYHDMERKMFLEFEGAGTVEAFGAAAKTQKLLQLANGAVYLDPEVEGERDPRAKKWHAVHDAKLEALESIIEEHDGSPMMVVYSFRSDLARLKKMLSDKAVDLSTSRGLEEFKRGTVPYGLCHGASVGHGIDGLQEHCYTITHFGHDWSLDNFDQINERIGPVRQFQSGHTDRLVRHNMILARDTVDEEVTERRASKRDVQDVLLEAMKRRNKR